MMRTLKVENGCFSYNMTNQDTIKNVNFEMKSGDLVAILGPNGAGKTTLLRCVIGFLAWKSGRTLLDSKDIREYSARELFSIVSYVPQARTTVAAYTVSEMVLLGRSSHIGMFSKPSKKDYETTESVIEELGLEKLRNKRCSEISGGELQMVLIARAMCSNPSLLILDEPESNLDFRNQLIVMQTLSALKDKGVACLFNTHFPAHALQYAEKSVLLGADGTSVFGETGKIVSQENIETGFGVKAVIGNIEAQGRTIRDVVPLGII